MSEIRDLAKKVLANPSDPEAAKNLALLVLVERGTAEVCTGQPCPHCGEKLPRFHIQTVDHETWNVHISDVIKGDRNMKALGNLIKGLVK